jgi:hypothetical protein
MKTHSGKGPDETRETASMSDMSEALRKNCEQALRTGLKLQEEAGRWWGSVLNPATCAQRWQEQFNSATRTANSVLPLAQKPLGEVIDLFEKNTRTSAELLKKAFEATQAPAISESQTKWTEFWTESLGTMRSNTEALSQIGAKAIDSWVCFVQDNTRAQNKA